MKKVILLGVVILGMATSCTKEVCVYCKEINSRVPPESYCGYPSDARDWERCLKRNEVSPNGYVNSKEWICNKQKFK